MIARWPWPGPAGARTWTQIWTFAWATSQRLGEIKVLSSPKSVHNLCGVRILFSSVESAEIEDNCESIPTLILQTERSCGRYDGGGTRTASRRGLSGGFGRALGPGVLIVSVADFFRFHSKIPIVMKSGPGNDEITVSHRKITLAGSTNLTPTSLRYYRD